MMSRLNMDHLQEVIIENWSLKKFRSKALSWFDTCSRASSVSSPCVFINEINFEIKSYESSDLFCSWKRIKNLVDVGEGCWWEIYVGEKSAVMLVKSVWVNMYEIVCYNFSKILHQHTFKFLSAPTYSFVNIHKILLQHTLSTNIFHQHHYSQKLRSDLLNFTWMEWVSRSRITHPLSSWTWTSISLIACIAIVPTWGFDHRSPPASRSSSNFTHRAVSCHVPCPWPSSWLSRSSLVVR